MKLPRRKFLHLAAGAAALPTATRFASALDYPGRRCRSDLGSHSWSRTEPAPAAISPPRQSCGHPQTVTQRADAGPPARLVARHGFAQNPIDESSGPKYTCASPASRGPRSEGEAAKLSLAMAGEMFKMMAGVDLFHVPYRGYIRAGNLRALAVTTTTRSQILPDVPVRFRRTLN